ncbi:MAG: hypothetical protein WBV46_13760 [Terriglobales bacterium]|jgi:hypothetical protein
MSNEPIRNHDVDAHGSFEKQDLSPRSVMGFFVGLIVLVAVIFAVAFGVYRALDAYNHANQATMSPMVAPETDTRNVTRAETHAFPQPRLEENERTELREFIEDQDQKLATYNWVDKDKGIVQIPIDRAMELIVQRGLPVRPQGAKSQGDASPEAQPQKEGSSAQ